MNKLFLYLLLISSIIFTSCDIRKPNTQAKSKVNSTNDSTKKNLLPTTVEIIDSAFDFGKVKEGEIVEYNYRFKNSGKNPLIIEDAMASCGCTVPEKPDHPIQPGEMDFIKVKFNSDKRPGEAHKTITITSNANPEFPTLILKGTVIGKSED
jgi:hypothetical protein